MFEHEFLDQIPLYAAGALNEKERRAVEEHLQQGCGICEPELRFFQEAAMALPFALPNHPLPTQLKAKIAKRIDSEFKRPQVIEWQRVIAVAATLASILLAASLIWMERLQERQLRTQQQEIIDLQKRMQLQKAEIAWLRDPSVQLAMLTGLEPAPGAKGRMLWNPSQSKGIFYANWLPPLSAGKSYQLWVIGKGGPVSAGVFEPSAGGSAVVTVSHIAYRGGALQFAVTIEPRGGVPQPTGTMVLAGKPL